MNKLEQDYNNEIDELSKEWKIDTNNISDWYHTFWQLYKKIEILEKQLRSWMYRHWMEWTRIYKIWAWMKTRCTNSNIINWNNYGWRWIKCEWDTFENFYTDMIEWYNDLLQIDRIDVNWNYNKQNCRWVDLKTQARNKRNNVYYKWKTISQLREEKNISKWVFDNLRYKKKLSLEEIFW